jgi:uncharacterized protein
LLLLRRHALKEALRPLLPAIACAAAGCASYPQRTEEAFRAFQGGHFEEAHKLYADPEVTDAPFLAGAEAGMTALAAGDWETAVADFHRAAETVQDLEERALVSASSLAEGLSSWALNDLSLPYRGEGFERVTVHTCLGLAYLALGRLDDVWVEVQRANALLEAEEELYEKEYKAGGLGHFLSATAYELLGRYDEAYIDYKRMEEKGVGTQLAGRALVRLANQLGWDDDAERYASLYGEDLDRPAGAANVVLIAGVGTGPYKDEGKLWVPTSDGLIAFAVPTYTEHPQPVSGLRLSLGTGESVLTDVLENVVQVAEENLSDRLAWIAAKSIARGVAKRELTKQLEDEWDLGGRIIGDVFAIATERADQRAWQTLPAAWHAARLFVPPGAHALSLEALGGQRVELGAFELEEGETLVILARTLEGRLYAHAIGGTPVAEADPKIPGTL